LGPVLAAAVGIAVGLIAAGAGTAVGAEVYTREHEED
jgi:hypothetical protein